MHGVSTYFSINKAAKTSPKSLNTPTMQVPASSKPRDVMPAAWVGHLTEHAAVSVTLRFGPGRIHYKFGLSFHLAFYPCFYSAFALSCVGWTIK